MKDLKELFDALVEFKGYPTEEIIFKDIIPLISDEELRYHLVCHLVERLPEEVEVIAAPETRGALLGILVADASGKDFMLLRKKGKLPGKLHSVTYKTEYSEDTLECQQTDLRQKRVWFIDDVFATGGTFEACKDLIEKCNGNLIGGIVLLDIFNNLSDSKDAPNPIIELFKGVY